MSQKISLKNILIGAAIGLAVVFLTGLIFYYFLVFLPNQETRRMEKAMEEYERLFWKEYQQEEESIEVEPR